MKIKGNIRSKIDKAVLEIKSIKTEGVKRWRSWRKLRKHIIKSHPYCAVCGWDKKLEGHHILPRHKYPDLSLLESNVIILCRNCHFCIGHWCDFVNNYNIDIRDIAVTTTNRRKVQNIERAIGRSIRE